MEKCEESVSWDESPGYSVTILMEERIQCTLNAFDNPEKLLQKEHKSSEILKTYIENVGKCSSKTRRRCISQRLR